MPEFYGLCMAAQNAQLSASIMESLRTGLEYGRHVHHNSKLSPYGGIGILSCHDNDPAILAAIDTPPGSLAWIGNTPVDDSESEIASLAGHVTANEQLLPVTIDPPFAAIIIRHDQPTMSIRTDPYGLQPVYYFAEGGFCVACTKLFPLARCGIVGSKLNPCAVLDLFTYEHLTGDRTLLENVKLLAPNSRLTYREGLVRISRCCEPPPIDSPSSKSVRETADHFYDTLSTSVSRAVQSRKHVAVTLSGGLDSRALLALSVKHSSHVHAYTFGHPKCPDVVFARQLANLGHISHTAIKSSSSFFEQWLDYGIFITGGMVNCIHYHILMLKEILASQSDVVLDGLGGDAICGGHIKWGMIGGRNPQRVMDKLYRQRATGLCGLHDRLELFQPNFLKTAGYDPKDAVSNHFRKSSANTLWKCCHQFDMQERQRRFIQYGPHLLRPFVNVQTPFYSGGLPELGSNAPASHLIEQRAYLHMHQHHFADFASISDTARGMPVSWPQSIRFAKKVWDYAGRKMRSKLPVGHTIGAAGPTDYPQWFRGELYDFIRSRLLDDRNSWNDMVKPSAVEQLLTEHHTLNRDHTIKLGCLLTLQSARSQLGATI